MANGLARMQVRVDQMIPSRSIAVCKEISTNKSIEVYVLPMRTGRLPAVGESWILDREYNGWTFAALLSSPTAFTNGNGGTGGGSGDGADGDSAYDIAVEHGFVGTEAQWLASLEGEPGQPGPASTVPGPPGPANSLSIGTVTTGAAGAPAAASITGTAPVQQLHLTIPQGSGGGIGGGGTGEDGSIWWTGTSAPTSGVGKIKDFYLNTTNGNVYEKTSDTVWTYRGNIRGPEGIQGPEGEVLIVELTQDAYYALPVKDPKTLYVITDAVGTPGPPGEGVPTGGSVGQMLVKAGSADFNTAWVTPVDVESVRDLVGSVLVAGANVTITVNDAANTVTVAATGSGGGGLDLEAVQDAVAAMITDSATVTKTYDDTAGTLTLTAAAPGLDLEAVQDAVAAMFVDSTTVTKAYNDAAGTITLTAISAGGGSGSGGGYWRGPWLPATSSAGAPTTATASSTLAGGWEPWRSFNGGTGSGDHWSSQAGGFVEWLAGEWPTAFKLQSYTLSPATDGWGNMMPASWVVEGSNNGTDWTPLDTRSGITWPGDAPRTFVINATTAYSRYRMANMQTSQYVMVGDWALISGTDPYMAKDTVTYNSKIWRSTVNNNSATPGGAGWTEEVIVVESTDVSDFAEAVQDAVGAMIVDSATVTKSYNDTAGTLTLTATATGGLDTEAVQDAVAAMIVDSATVTKTYDDAAGTISLTATGGGGGAAVPGTLVLRGPYSGVASYVAGDVVTRSGGVFVATQDAPPLSPAVPSPPFLDSFDATNAPLPAPWEVTNTIGTSTDPNALRWQSAGGTATSAPNNTVSTSTALVNFTSTDGVLTVTGFYRTNNLATRGVIIRFADTANYLAIREVSSSTSVQIVSVVSGITTVLDTFTTPGDAAFTIVATASGTTLSVNWGGVARSVTVPAPAPTAGRWGIWSGGGGGNTGQEPVGLTSVEYAPNNVTGWLVLDADWAARLHTHSISDVTLLQTTLDGKAPTVHTHVSTSITDLAEAVQDTVATMVTNSATITKTYDDTAGTLTLTAVPPGLDTEAVQDAVAAMVVAGTNITKTYDDTAGTLTLSATAPGLDTEAVQDVVGAMIVDSATVTRTYDDAAGTLSLTAVPPAFDTEAVQDAVAAMIVDSATVTKVYNDAAGTLTLTATGASGGGGGTSLWRGAWSTLEVKTSTTLVDAAALTTIGGVVSGNTAFIAPPAGVGTPGQGAVLAIGQLAAVGFMNFTIPTGVTQVRYYAKIDDGFWDCPQEVRINGVVTPPTYPLTDWTSFTRTVTPGQDFGFNSQAQYGSWGSWYIATIDLLGPSANPYMVGQYVTHLGRLWVSNSDNNSGVPGTSGWTEVQWTIDSADIPDLTESVQDVVAAMVTNSATVTKTYDDTAGTLTLTALTIPPYKGDWNSATNYLTNDQVSSGGALWNASIPSTNAVPSLAPAASLTGGDGGPGNYSITGSLGMNAAQLAHPVRFNAAVRLSGIRITQHNATAPPASIEVNVLAAAPTGTGFTPLFATVATVPVAVGSNRYDLALGTIWNLSANTDYWIWIRAVGTTFIDMNGQLGGSYTYSGNQIAAVSTTTTLGRTDAGTWTDYGAGRHIYLSTLTTPASSWTRIAVETVLPPRVPYTYSDMRPILTAPSVGVMKIPNMTGRTLTLVGVRVDVVTAPAGGPLVIDTNVNGTTIFTTQSNRPSVAAGAFFANSGTINAPTWANGQTLTVDIDTVGTTTPGGQMTVTVLAEG